MWCQDMYTVEQICGGVSVFPTAEKTLSVLVNLILPLCMRMGGSGNRTGNLCLQCVDTW